MTPRKTMKPIPLPPSSVKVNRNLAYLGTVTLLLEAVTFMWLTGLVRPLGGW